MDVLSINYTNIQEIYNLMAMSDIRISDYNGFVFGNRHNEVLNNLAVTLHLSNVNMLEYAFMKLRYNSTTNLNGTFVYDKKYVSKQYPEIYDSICRFNTTLNTIKEHTKSDFSTSVLPLGVLTDNVTIRLTGTDISNLFGNDFASLFRLATKNECVETTEDGQPIFKTNYNICNEKMDKYVISKFTDDFYNFLLSTIKVHDNMSEIFLSNHIIRDNLSKDDVALLGVYNPYFLLDFSKYSDLKGTLENYRKLSKNINFSLSNTKMKFILNTPISTFIEIISCIPLACLKFKNLTNLTIKKTMDSYANIPQCPESVKALKTRYHNAIEKIINSINENYMTDENLIKYIYMGFPFTNVAYELELSFNDINNYLVPLLDINSTEYSHNSTVTTINTIVRNAKIICKEIL